MKERPDCAVTGAPPSASRWPAADGVRLHARRELAPSRRVALERILTRPEDCVGLVAREDPERPGFFDFSHDGWLYFVYVYPSRRTARLLEAWRLGDD